MIQNRLIKSRNGSATSSNVTYSQDKLNSNNSMMTESNGNDISDFNQKSDKKQNSQNYNDFTSQLQRERKINSQNQILKAFNSIRDMNNKEQINQALLMITQVKDRVLLIEKLLERREQIAKAKEMQQINNLAPLFNKIKAKFLNSLEKRKYEKTSTRNIKQKSTFLQQSQKDVNGIEGQQPQGAMQQQLDTSGNTLKQVLTNRSSTRKKTALGTIIPQSPKNQNSDQEEDSNAVQQQNKNIMGAITIFATHDIKMDKEKEENDKKQRHNTLLGYLQKDNILKTEDRLKSPLKQPKRKSNGNQSTGTLIMNTSNNNPSASNNASSGAIVGNNKQQQQERPKSLSILQSQQGDPSKLDYNQKMLALKKKMFQVGPVGRRESPQSNSSKLFRVRSMNGSPSQFKKHSDIDHVKDNVANKYYFQPQLNNFSQAASSGFHSQSSGNFNNTLTNSQLQPHHRRSSTNKHSNEGVLFDFIIECEQKRLINKYPQFNNDPLIQKRQKLKSQGVSKMFVPFKTSVVPCKNIQIRNNENNSILNKIYFMRKQYSNTNIDTKNQMQHSKQSKSKHQEEEQTNDILND